MFTMSGNPAALGTGANNIIWQCKVNATGTGTAADGTIDVAGIAPNSHIIPLTGTWAANDKLVLTLELTYNGITITKTGALTVNFD